MAGGFSFTTCLVKCILASTSNFTLLSVGVDDNLGSCALVFCDSPEALFSKSAPDLFVVVALVYFGSSVVLLSSAASCTKGIAPVISSNRLQNFVLMPDLQISGMRMLVYMYDTVIHILSTFIFHFGPFYFCQTCLACKCKYEMRRDNTGISTFCFV